MTDKPTYEELEQRLSENKRFAAGLQALLENSSDCILLCDKDSKPVFFNEAYAGVIKEFLGIEMVPGLIPHKLLPDAEARKWWDKLHERVLAGETFSTEYRHELQEGNERIFELSYTPILTAGEVRGFTEISRDITARRRAEIHATERGRFIESIVNLSPEILYIYDLVEHRNIYSNEGIRAVLGYSPEEIGAMGDRLLSNLMHPKDFKAHIEETVPRYARAKDGERITHQYRMKAKSGEWRWLESTEIIYQREPDGSPRQILGVIQDITDRKQAEEDLEEERKRLTESQRIAHIGSWEHNLATNRAFWSDELFRLLGLDPEKDEEDFELFFSMIHPDDQPLLKKAIENTLQLHTPFKVEYRFIRRDGTIRTLLALAELIPDISGELVILSGTGQDITERKQAEELISKSESRLRESQEVAKIGSWIWDLVNNTLEWSDETCRRFDKDPTTFTPTVDYWVDRIHSEEREIIQKAIENSLTNDTPYHIQPRIRNETGREWVLEGFGRVERDAAGKPLRFAGTAQDITERVEAEKKIRESEEYIRNILDTVDDGFIVVDRDYRIMTANKAYCGQVGLACAEVVGKYCHEVSHLSERPCYETGEECAVREAFATGVSRSAIHRHVNKDGEILYVETKAFPNRDEAGNIVAAIETTHNITERHLLEAEQLKIQKLEAIGTLAGGIAHDFNNLLQGVFGYVTMAKLSVDTPEKVSELLDQAEKALSMSVNLTTQLLTFAKGGKPLIKNTDLRPVIENASKFALSGSKCLCHVALPRNLWLAEADDGQLAQVIQNLVLNASEAMPEGGSIDISAENVELQGGSSALQPNGGKFIKLVIRDTGVGIPEKHLQKIFDPYFTTKQKGSGLGLATSYSIIRNHGGAIEVISKPGHGTTFFIYLPATETGKGESALVSGAPATRKCRILVMDDEEVVLDVAKAMLMALGHEVEATTDSAHAVEKYRQALVSENPFDIVILDLTIKGGMGGEETLARMLELDQNVKAIVASGYSDNSVLNNFQGHGFSAVLSKPYSLATLRDCLSALVG
jgi:PAS domain S-box-containing protein